MTASFHLQMVQKKTRHRRCSIPLPQQSAFPGGGESSGSSSELSRVISSSSSSSASLSCWLSGDLSCNLVLMESSGGEVIRLNQTMGEAEESQGEARNSNALEWLASKNIADEAARVLRCVCLKIVHPTS
ncbi:hypothetical protein MPTK1_5g16120 [Marchantia polymorpha subsp. ruderalis]|uniref:Uncharacterized protein n=2 Tax=Marchantia polymorpha TaxID=3197 RepID=A0AAF6BIV7_MARPO|nr:hypothetical protein MARPO_1497s0002 [Marchantia polymorpha]PTQ26469.1 hypothetical protein MARPO_1497s0002 [Marchantia polymorpha]BBN11941.1 hypothetical protein Mp_5g16120 [Marchantia polymorpha subsp. ruderalis]BBN11942.1 hypothetical protein Mp_5g16120 [Marchantia polymorpha subsp. ruderalis]|eukprot:PTQ26468.1 hypothetical protein MARPO_1497s0002 [Marchantia polymorpha]